MELSTKVISKLVDYSQKELANKIDNVKLRGDMRNMCFQPLYTNEDILKNKVKLADYYSYLVDNVFTEDCGIVFKSDNLYRTMFEAFYLNQNTLFAGDLLQLRNDLVNSVVSDASLMRSYVKSEKVKSEGKGSKKALPADIEKQINAVMGKLKVPEVSNVLSGKGPVLPMMPMFSNPVKDETNYAVGDFRSAFLKEYSFDFDMPSDMMASVVAQKSSPKMTDVMKRYYNRLCLDNLVPSEMSNALALKSVIHKGTTYSSQYYGSSSELFLNLDWFDKAWDYILEADKNAGRSFASLPDKRRDHLKKLALNNYMMSSLSCRSFVAVQYKDDFENAMEEAKYIVSGPVSREVYEDTAFGLFVKTIKAKISSEDLRLIEATRKYWGSSTFAKIMASEYDGADIYRFIESQRNETIDDYLKDLSNNQLSFSDGLSVAFGNVECSIVPCENEVIFMLKNKCCDDSYTENPYFFNCCLILTRETVSAFKSTTNLGFFTKLFDFINELTFDKVVKNGIVFSDLLGNQLIWNKEFLNYCLDYDFMATPEVQCVCQKLLLPTHNCKLSRVDTKGVPALIDTDPSLSLFEALYESLKKGINTEVSVLTNYVNKKIVLGIFSEVLNLGFCMNREEHVNRYYDERDTFNISKNVLGVVPKYKSDGYAVLFMDKQYASELNSLALTYDDIKNCSEDNDFVSFVSSLGNIGTKKVSKKQSSSESPLSQIVGLRRKIAEYYDDYKSSSSVIPVVLKGCASLDYLKKDFLLDVNKLGIPYEDIKIIERGITLKSSFTLTTKETEVAPILAYYPLINPVVVIRAYILMALQGCFCDNSCIFPESLLVRGTFEYRYAAMASRIILLEILSDENKRIKFFDIISDKVQSSLGDKKKSTSSGVDISVTQIIGVLSEMLEDIKDEDFMSNSVISDLLVNVYKSMIYNRIFYVTNLDYMNVLYSKLPRIENNNLSGLPVAHSLEMILDLCPRDYAVMASLSIVDNDILSKELCEVLDNDLLGLISSAVAKIGCCDLLSDVNKDVLESYLDDVSVSESNDSESVDTSVDEIVSESVEEISEEADEEVVEETVEETIEEVDEVSVVEEDEGDDLSIDSLSFKEDFDSVMSKVASIGLDVFKDLSNDADDVVILRALFKKLVTLSPKAKSTGVKVKFLAPNVNLFISLVSDKAFCKSLGITSNREYLRSISKYLKSSVKN